MSKKLDLNSWKLVSEALRLGSLAAAARSLSIDPSTAVRTVSALEESVGRPLVLRGRRPFTLTPFGNETVERVREIISEHEAILREISEDATTLSGLIRLSVASGYASTGLVPMLGDFLCSYPQVDFSVSIAETASDVANGHVDIAFVTGMPKESGLVSLYRDHSIFIPVATPGFIAEHGPVEHPDDLKRLTGFSYTGPIRQKTCVLQRNDQKAVVKWGKEIEIADILAVKQAVLSGKGVTLDLPILHCADELIAGNLVPILSGWRRPSIDCFAVTTESGYKIRRIRTFLDWFVERSVRLARERDGKVAQKAGLLL